MLLQVYDDGHSATTGNKATDRLVNEGALKDLP